MKKNLAIIIIAVLCILNASAQNPINHTYPPTDGPDKNPMKGWNSGWWDDFDVATVGFQYIKWNEFEPTDGNFNFDYVEDVIDRPGSNGKHLILRLYADWFGANETSDACPQWLYDDYGVARLQSPNGKYITDYNDSKYITQVTEALVALANEYNDDPRIYTFQIGVLGYWGEWHTFTFNDDNFEIETATRTQILNTVKSIFSNKTVTGRQPWDEPLTSTGNIGFHNDFFVPNDGHSDEFDDSILLNSQWLEGPIGGESPPIDSNDTAQFRFDLYETTKGMDMINTGHYSTMKLGSDLRPCADDPTGVQCESFMALHRKMGYNFQITSAVFPEVAMQSENLTIDVAIKNIGVAPIYYDWDVQFALIDDTNQAVEVFDATYNLKNILADGTTHTISLSSSLNSIATDNYELGIRLIQPDADAEKPNPWGLESRNTYINFANDLPKIEGTWDTNNALKGGWSILGSVSVLQEILTTPNVLVFHKTNGFRHGSIDNGIDLITSLGETNNRWTTTETQDSSDFNAQNLSNYDLVIWCNTSGNNLLTAAEQSAFETWITNGGAFMGIHAATDTYRNGSWPFYNELVGAIVQTGPNHTPNNHNDNMAILEKHPSVDHLGSIWNKTEEYYYWELNGGQLSSDNNNVLFVESTGNDSYDAPRAMAWYKTSITVNNVTTPVRAFYTALGHNDSDYNDDTNFQQHIEGAIIWALPAEVTTFTTNGWDNGIPNTANPNLSAVIASSYNTATNGSIAARNLLINAGVTVTVNPNSYMNIGEDITVNGSLIVEHQGSVVQKSNIGQVINNGTVHVNITTPQLKPRDFMVLGNPMDQGVPIGLDNDIFRKVNHTTTNFRPHPDVQALFPDGTNFVDEDFNDWSIHTGNYIPGEGYYTWPQPSFNEGNEQYDILYNGGTLNNGVVTYALDFNTTGTGTGTPAMNKNASPNIIANPYASAISAQGFIAANDAVDELYFWEHNTTPSPEFPGANSSNFNMADISTYNNTGFNPAATQDDTTIVTGDFSIATGQGFGIKNNGATTGTGQDVNFSNVMRRVDGNTTLRNAVEDQDNIWLSIKNEEFELGSSVLIGFNNAATSAYDSGFDSERIGVPVSLYSHLEDGTRELGIQGREAFTANALVPLGFSTQIEQDNAAYSIAVKNRIGNTLENVTVYLKDNKTGKVINISETPYTFNSPAGAYNNRFILQFIDEQVLSTSEIALSQVSIFPNPTNDVLSIFSPTSKITSAVITDLHGRIILNTPIEATDYQIDVSALDTAVYFVTIHTNEGSVTKRMIKK